ncbi:hypothetical protein BDV36DRAFT_265183 [Aspergillus pseudocaelatus]|uniref:Uncharacterized protein n=1 Tax=Aspergillus pseudocaelatus TaxID=1825620 RepID=A0ABQ6WE86_9EURO|nr:hypothetical protein BDV36DRAFT_265183 [Aspergillus pseudocaelatus]
MQSCQYYPLAGLFYANAVRPVDEWTMIYRATTCCRMFWENPPSPCDAWVADMQSRLFWNAAMFEVIFTQELTLPSTEVHILSEQVPLPRFVKLEQHPFLTMGDIMDKEDESFFHYHFLAQIAHRILLTRTKNPIFYSTPDGRYPSPSLKEELSHQLIQ